MCPLCIGTALLLWGGTSSAGGVAAVTLRSIKRPRNNASPTRSSHNVAKGAGTCEEKLSPGRVMFKQ
jgi:hypothetical protein